MGSAVAVVLMLVVIVGTSSVVNASCSSSYTIANLSPCYSAVEKDGSKPSDDCCATLNSWGLDCLCGVLSKYGTIYTLPSFVDPTEVVALPEECELPAVPSGYDCAGYIFP